MHDGLSGLRPEGEADEVIQIAAALICSPSLIIAD